MSFVNYQRRLPMLNWFATLAKSNPRRDYPDKWQHAKITRDSLQNGHVDVLHLGFCDNTDDSDKKHPYFYIYHYSWPWSGLFPRAERHPIYWICVICDQEGYINSRGNKQTVSPDSKPCWA